MEDFPGDFPSEFLWALFPHKNEGKKSGEKIREKIRRLKKKTSREKSVLLKADPNLFLWGRDTIYTESQAWIHCCPPKEMGQNVTRNGGPQIGACWILSDKTVSKFG